MKIFTHRKIIYIFLLAIFLPLLILVYLSLSTFVKRRDAVKKLLESNLWISGEAAIQSIEGDLLELEKTALKSENYLRLIQSEKTDHAVFSSSIFSKDIAKQFFLLDADYKTVYPETGRENSTGILWEKQKLNSQFAQSFQSAELFEFTQKDFPRAVELYKECTLSAPSGQTRAIAYEGLGRCLFAIKKYPDAEKAYRELSEYYGQFNSKAGHPYGIIASFQLYEIAREENKEVKSLRLLSDLYKRIRDGIWQVNLSVYDFYISEIESIFNSKLNEGEIREIQKSFLDMQKQQSPYRQSLIFADLLKRNTIPKIKEKLSLNRAAGEVVPMRLLIPLDKEFFLVSFDTMPNFQTGQTFYGGFFWDIDFLKNQILPKLLEKIAKDTGLDFIIVDEKGQNIITGIEELIPGESLVLTYRMFPLPWKLVISQPETKAIENTTRREIFFYGVLLIIVAALMLLGAVLIARDISRESETTQLKTEFVNNISHELKTPLTLIRLYGETLQRKGNLTSKEKKECYEIITKESERLSHLINNVLDFSRIETGRKEFDFKKGNLAEITRDTLESYRYHLEKKGFVIHKDIAGNLPDMNFDGEAIASLLINLLSNAMKFSLKEKEVTVKLFRDNGNAILQVSDKGIGISQKEIPKIFQRFYQSKNRIGSEAKGSGLGLTLVKHITEAHGGTIQVESEVDKGSRFIVSIPIDGI
jgi:signal transduction histidine kinase